MTIKRVLIIISITLLLISGCGGSEDEGKKTAAPAPKAKSDTQASSTEALATYKIKDASGNEIARVKRMSDVKWTYRVSGKKYSLTTGDNYSFKLPDGVKYKAKRKEDKLKLKSGDDVHVEVKYYKDKMKVTPQSGEVFQIKYKEGKVKVYRGDDELGQINFYADKEKLKAKNIKDDEVASVKGVKYSSASLAPFLIGDDMPEYCRAFLTLLFFADGA